jgi:transposase
VALWTYKQIHQQYPSIPISTIKSIVQRSNKCLENQSLPRSGRPRKLSEEERDRIWESIHGNPNTTYEDLLSKVDHKVAKRSIQRLLHEMDLRKWHKLERPLLSDAAAIKRLRWAQTYEHFTPEDWARVYWSDECSVERGAGQRQEWTFTRPRDQIKSKDLHLKPCGKQPSQMFWAAFSGECRRTGLIPLFGNPESLRGGVDRFVIRDLYRRVLPTLIMPGGIFMHDNAATHTAYIVRDTLYEMGIEVMDWPPYSPDLNPIENLWALLKAKIYEICPRLKENLPKNQETWELLLDTAERAWQELDPHYLVDLSESMPRRVKAVIEADGWYTKY